MSHVEASFLQAIYRAGVQGAKVEFSCAGWGSAGHPGSGQDGFPLPQAHGQIKRPWLSSLFTIWRFHYNDLCVGFPLLISPWSGRTESSPTQSWISSFCNLPMSSGMNIFTVKYVSRWYRFCWKWYESKGRKGVPRRQQLVLSALKWESSATFPRTVGNQGYNCLKPT